MKIIYQLNVNLIKTDDKINIILCDGCKKKIEKLTDEYGNQDIASFLYNCKKNAYNDNYVQWIPFNEFINIEYLARGGFGEVHKATWINHYNIIDEEYGKEDVVLKRLHNSNDKILDILKEVKV